MRVFLSYSFNDQDFVGLVNDHLKKSPDLEPFCYGHDKRAQPWLEQISEELDLMDAFLIFLGDKVGDTQTDEVGTAMGMRSKKRIRVMLGEDVLPRKLAILRAWPVVKVTSRDDNGARECAEEIARLLRAGEGGAEEVRARIEEPIVPPPARPVEPAISPPSPSPEPAVTSAQSPEPAVTPAQSPEPASAPVPSPEPASVTALSPEPASAPALSPEPASVPLQPPLPPPASPPQPPASPQMRYGWRLLQQHPQLPPPQPPILQSSPSGSALASPPEPASAKAATAEFPPAASVQSVAPKGSRWKLPVAIAGLVVVILLALFAVLRQKQPAPSPPGDVSSLLAQFEKLIDRYYRHNPTEAAKARAEAAVDDYNAWLKQNESSLSGESDALDSRKAELRTLEGQLDPMRAQLESSKPDPSDAVAVERHNGRVQEYNALVEKQRKLAQAYEPAVTAYNRRAKELRAEIARRKAATEATQTAAQKEVREYQQWLDGDGPMALFVGVNRLYATLREQARRSGHPTPELASNLQRVKAMRRELGTAAMKEQRSATHGLLLVAAELPEGEQGYFIVDNSATVSSLTEEMVDILGIRGHVGEPVSLSLPNQIHIMAPQVAIPSVSLGESQAAFVKAVVLRPSMTGVDGSLGLTFLDRFKYTIKKGEPAELTLSPLAGLPGDLQFDVYICHHSADLPYARQVFDALTAAGYRPFLSEVSIPEDKRAEAQSIAYALLASAPQLVLVSSSAANVKAPWVEAEWRLYASGEGVTQTALVTVLCGEMKPADLPADIARHPSVAMADANWKANLVERLQRRARQQARENEQARR